MQNFKAPEQTINKPSINSDGLYQADLVVSCRIEDKDGAILFNPDLDKTTLINSTGLLIWNYIQEAHTIEEIYQQIYNLHSECPSKETLLIEITNFLYDLMPDFIIEVEPRAR